MMDAQKKNQLFIILIFVMSALPIVLAFIFQQHPELLRSGTNNGQLITPPITTSSSDFIGFDNFSNDNLKELSGHWLLATVMPTEHCNEQCLDALLKVKQLRLMLGLSQKQFAERVGVSFATVNRWERGHFKPSQLAIQKLAELERTVVTK